MTTPTRTVCNAVAIGTITLATAVAATSAEAYDAKFIGETQHWSLIRATENGDVAQCAATRKQPGPNKMMIVRDKDGWGVQFFNPKWASNEMRKTSARLTFENRSAPVTVKFANGTSFIFKLGSDIQALASARWLTFYTESGRKIGYPLQGHAEMIERVAACFNVGRDTAPAPTAGAFGDLAKPATPPAGAFAMPAPNNQPKASRDMGAFGESAPQPETEAKPGREPESGAFGEAPETDAEPAPDADREPKATPDLGAFGQPATDDGPAAEPEAGRVDNVDTEMLEI